MSIFTATMIAEGVQDADETTQIEAWQTLINTGVAWQLQGCFGRQAANLIEPGICTPPPAKPTNRRYGTANLNGGVQ